MLNHDRTKIKDSVFYSLVKPPEPIPSLIPELASITKEMVKYDLPFPDVMNYFLCFNMEVLTKVNARQQQILLVAHTGTRFDISFLFEECNTTMLYQTFILCFTLTH